MKRFLMMVLAAALVFSIAASAEKKKDPPPPPETVEQLIEKGEFQKAVELGQKMVAEGKMTPGLLVNIGVAYYKLKDYTNALNYLEQAFAKAQDPLSPDTQLQLQALLFEATIHHEMSLDEKVAEDYQRAMAIAPEDKQVLQNYARVLEAKDKAKALELYDKLVSLDPAAGFDAGVFAMQNPSDLERAEKYFNAARAVQPDNEELLLGMVKLYLLKKDFASAIPVLEKVLATTTRDILKPKLLLFLASCQLETQKPMEAIATCDKVMALRPNDEAALVCKAKAYRAMKDLKNAAASADAALAANPENEDANYYRAIVAIEQKDFKKAKPLCEKVVAITKNTARKTEVQGYLKEMKGVK